MNNHQQNPVVVLVWAVIGSLLGTALSMSGFGDIWILIAALIIGVSAVVLFWVILFGIAFAIDKLWGWIKG